MKEVSGFTEGEKIAYGVMCGALRDLYEQVSVSTFKESGDDDRDVSLQSVGVDADYNKE